MFAGKLVPKDSGTQNLYDISCILLLRTCRVRIMSWRPGGTKKISTPSDDSQRLEVIPNFFTIVEVNTLLELYLLA